MKKILLFSTCLMCLLMDAQDYTQERREVKDGKRTEAKASWWGFDKNNATKCLQDAINSGVKRLIVDNTGRDWILDRIVLASNQEIILEKNVRLVARKGGFQKVRGDSSFINFGGGHHIILRGEPGAVIIMHKKDYQNRTLYKPSEWRHMLDIRGGSHITIRDLRLESSGGDGIYIGNGNPPSRPVKNCSDIHIENVVIDNHHRQGISVIGVKNLLIRNCVISNTGGAAPQSGIDFEPNMPGEQLVNCRVEDCIIENNRGSGSVAYLVNLNGDSDPVSITYSRCKFRNNKTGVSVTVHKGKNRISPVRGSIRYIDCEIEGEKPVTLADTWEGLQVLLKDCRISLPKQTAILLQSANSLYQVGNVRFDHVNISETTPNMIPFQLKHVSSYASPFNSSITGDLLVDGKKFDYSADLEKAISFSRKQTEIKPASDPAGLHAPAHQSGKPRSANPNICWSSDSASMLFDAEKGEKIQIRLYPHEQFPGNDKITMLLFRPGMKIPEQSTAALRDSSCFNYEFTADMDGLHRVGVQDNMKSRFLRFESNHPGQGMYMNRSFQLFKPEGRVYFEVPANVKKFDIILWCDQGQRADVRLLNSAGECVKEVTRFSRTLLTKTRKRRNAEIWALELNNTAGAVNIMLMEPLSPVMSDRPEMMLRK